MHRRAFVKFVSLALVACLIPVAYCDNLILNGRFEADQVEVPTYWRSSDPDGTLKIMSCLPSGGPGCVPGVRFANPPGRKLQTASLRQYDLTLVKGGRYRISAWVRTKEFRPRRFGIIVINAKWRLSGGIEKVGPTADWHKLEAEIDMFDSLDGRYSVAIFMQKFTGEIEVADVALEPLSEDAKTGSKPSADSTAALRPRLVPWEPLLSKIPADTRTVTYRFCGELPKGMVEKDCKVAVEVDGCGEKLSYPLSEFTGITLPPDAPADGKLRISLVGKDGTALVDDVRRYALKQPKNLSSAGHRRLNNFVTEILNAPVDSADASFEFTALRDGWSYIRVEDAEKPSVFLDGREVVSPAWETPETFRNIRADVHKIKVVGAKGGRIIVRSVVETLNYPPCCDSYVKENGSYGWDFFKKHVMPNATTQNGGVIPKEHLAEYLSHGGEWFSNFVAAKHIKTSEELPDLISKSSRFTPSCYSGTTIDEFFLGSADSIERYGNGLKMFAERDPGEKRIYTWVIGKPGTDGLSRDFFATSANASKGRGKLLFEVYCRTKPTEEMARRYLRDYIRETIDRCRLAYPRAEASMGLILGNFNQIPLISAVHHPEVDYKHYLDMQMNYMANDPAFKGLACTGYWGSYYGDNEMHRWSMSLLRHYCIEGRTDMLSNRYGFKYIPGILKNGDFRGSFGPWTVSGNVRLDEAPGLGARSQRRWGCTDGTGDTFAAFSRKDGVAGRVAQTVKGLVPGRMYCLQAATFDVKDLKAERIAPRKYNLSVAISGVEAVPDLSWVHVDMRTKLSSKCNGARINLHHIVFKATSPEAVVSIDDSAAAPGEELGVNAVNLNPFYGEE